MGGMAPTHGHRNRYSPPSPIEPLDAAESGRKPPRSTGIDRVQPTLLAMQVALAVTSHGGSAGHRPLRWRVRGRGGRRRALLEDGVRVIFAGVGAMTSGRRRRRHGTAELPTNKCLVDGARSSTPWSWCPRSPP